MQALVAIHMVHRVGALVLCVAVLLLAWLLARGEHAALRRAARWLVLLTAAQVISGLSNVVLDWPIAAALAHSAGAALLVGLTTSLLARAAQVARS